MGAELSHEESRQGSYDLADSACDKASPAGPVAEKEMQETDAPSSELTPPAGFMEKFHAKVKQECMYELRKLKHQQRPVSDFSNKLGLERHFQEHSPSGAAGSEAASGSSVADRTKEFAQTQQSEPQSLMPESVRYDIRGLIERRPVHEILNGPVHDEIERALQEGAERRSRRQHRRRVRPHPEAPAPRPAVPRRDHARPRASRAPHQRPHHQRRVQLPPERPRLVNGRYPVRQRDQSEIMNSLRQSPALNTLDPEARNEIFAEVGNLVQQQLVSSALSGEFRGVLELHIQERAERVNRGQNGSDFMQQRRSSYRPRSAGPSDAPAQGDASYSELQQEVEDMKSQLLELKQMMKVSFDLQLDIQRSIRQEVAAALAAVTNTTTASASAEPMPQPTLPGVCSGSANVVSSGNCVICSEASIDSVVYRCGHMCVCMACGLELQGKGLKCPICRAPITEVIRAYTSML